MLFLSKRPNRSQNAPGAEACLSIIGLFLAIALISGLAGLIYGQCDPWTSLLISRIRLFPSGLTNNSSSAVVAGAAVFGVSLPLGIIFVLTIVFCLKTTQTKPNHRKVRGRMTHTNNPHEITGISTIQKTESPSGSYPQILYPPLPSGFTDSSHYGFGKQTLAPPMQTTTFDSLNQSYSSANGYHVRPDTANHY
jgi:hypothetical protein